MSSILFIGPLVPLSSRGSPRVKTVALSAQPSSSFFVNIFKTSFCPIISLNGHFSSATGNLFLVLFDSLNLAWKVLEPFSQLPQMSRDTFGILTNFDKTLFLTFHPFPKVLIKRCMFRFCRLIKIKMLHILFVLNKPDSFDVTSHVSFLSRSVPDVVPLKKRRSFIFPFKNLSCYSWFCNLFHTNQ